MVVATTYSYSLYNKRKIENIAVSTSNTFTWEETSNELILKTLPKFKADTINKEIKIDSEAIFDDGTSRIFIHFWGTWCAPCKSELPNFIKYAKKLENRSIKFILIAVNDTKIKVQKMLQKAVEEVPSSVLIVLDPTSSIMSKFGTVKVPETYIFDFKGVTQARLIGPQAWENLEYQEYLDKYLKSP